MTNSNISLNLTQLGLRLSRLFEFISHKLYYLGEEDEI